MPQVSTIVRNTYVQVVETLVLAENGAAVVTASGGALSAAMNLFSKKGLVQLTVSEVSAGDGAVDAAVDLSIDGADWFEAVASLSLDLDTTGLNTVTAALDLTAWSAPYARIRLFTDGTDLVDDASVTVTVVAPHQNAASHYQSDTLLPT